MVLTNYMVYSMHGIQLQVELTDNTPSQDRHALQMAALIHVEHRLDEGLVALKNVKILR